MTDRPEVDLYEALKSAKEYQDTMQGLNPSFCAKIKTLSDTAAKYRTLAKALEAGEVRIVPVEPTNEMVDAAEKILLGAKWA